MGLDVGLLSMTLLTAAHIVGSYKGACKTHPQKQGRLRAPKDKQRAIRGQLGAISGY